MRVSLWVENGGNRDRLWETVKNAERREGVVVSARTLEGQSRSPSITGDQAVLVIWPPAERVSKADRELASTACASRNLGSDTRGDESRDGRYRMARKGYRARNSARGHNRAMWMGPTIVLWRGGGG